MLCFFLLILKKIIYTKIYDIVYFYAAFDRTLSNPQIYAPWSNIRANIYLIATQCAYIYTCGFNRRT